MEIKILCACGSKFKFDLEPVDGMAPAELACPNCRTSWTEQANAIIRQSSDKVVSAPAGVPAESSAGRVRLRLGTHETDLENSGPETAPGSTDEAADAPVAAPAMPKRRVKRAQPTANFDSGPEPADWGKFGLGSVGALGGAILGGVLYYLFFSMGLESKLMALGVAAIAGLSARLIGRKGSNELGLLTAAFSIGAIVMAQYCVAGDLSAELRTTRTGQDYAALVTDVKNVLRTIPNGTEDEIRAHLALQKWVDEDGNRVTPESISEEEVREFREETLPMFRRLADGTMSEEEWKASMGIQDGAVDDTENADEIEFTTKGIFVLMAFNRFNLVCLIAAAGLAYKLTDV